jgi:PAP2 superfamily C-terminal
MINYILFLPIFIFLLFLLYYCKMNEKDIVFTIILLIIHIIFVYMCHYNGKKFYEDRKKRGKTTQKVFDIGHRYLPDYSNITFWHIIMNVFIFAPLLLNTSIFGDYLSYTTPLALLKYVTSNVTILPKSKNCCDESFNVIHLLHGHCYDKIFSAHFAGSVVISLLLYDKGIVTNPKILIGYNMISAFLILATRSHYTVDVILGGYIAATSYLLGINFDFMKNML